MHFDVHTAGFRPKHSTKAILGSANNAVALWAAFQVQLPVALFVQLTKPTKIYSCIFFQGIYTGRREKTFRGKFASLEGPVLHHFTSCSRVIPREAPYVQVTGSTNCTIFARYNNNNCCSGQDSCLLAVTVHNLKEEINSKNPEP